MKITPEAVVARYKELGVKPMIGTMNLAPNDEGFAEFLDKDYGCCALGVMGHGMFIGDGDWSVVVANNLEVQFWEFVDGFDGHPLPERFRSEHPDRDKDYELGKACRAAVEAEFGPLGRTL